MPSVSDARRLEGGAELIDLHFLGQPRGILLVEGGRRGLVVRTPYRSNGADTDAAVLGSNARENYCSSLLGEPCDCCGGCASLRYRFLVYPARGCLSCQIAQAVNILPQRSQRCSEP